MSMAVRDGLKDWTQAYGAGIQWVGSDVNPWPRHDRPPTGGPCAVSLGLAGPRDGQRVFFIQASMLTIIKSNRFLEEPPFSTTSTASCTGCFIFGATISPSCQHGPASRRIRMTSPSWRRSPTGRKRRRDWPESVFRTASHHTSTGTKGKSQRRPATIAANLAPSQPLSYLSSRRHSHMHHMVPAAAQHCRLHAARGHKAR